MANAGHVREYRCEGEHLDRSEIRLFMGFNMTLGATITGRALATTRGADSDTIRIWLEINLDFEFEAVPSIRERDRIVDRRAGRLS